MARARRVRGRLRPEVAINVTSLIDVVFILLIVFMLVAPALKHGLDVELAQTEGGQPVSPERPITVTISHDPGDEDSRFYIDGQRVEFDRLHTLLEARLDASASASDFSVLIEPAATAPTQSTLQVLGIVLDLGIQNYAFLTEPMERE